MFGKEDSDQFQRKTRIVTLHVLEGAGPHYIDDLRKAIEQAEDGHRTLKCTGDITFELTTDRWEEPQMIFYSNRLENDKEYYSRLGLSGDDTSLRTLYTMLHKKFNGGRDVTDI